jgi:hypothetical protein
MFYNIWTYVGIALLAWVGYDLYAGYTFTWEIVNKEESPLTYWSVISVWTILSVSCFFSGGSE